MKAQYDESQSMMKDIKEANSAAPTKMGLEGLSLLVAEPRQQRCP